jgi:hypothetical protein
MGYPRRGRVSGGAEDTYPAGGVFDDRQHVQSGPPSVEASKKSAAMMASAWERRNAAQVCEVRVAAGVTHEDGRVGSPAGAATLKVYEVWDNLPHSGGPNCG